MNIDNIGKYRNILLPLADSIAIIISYYLVSVLISDTFLDIGQTISHNNLLISILLAIIVLQVVFRFSRRYSNIIRYENNHDYLMYIVLSLLSLIIVSIIEEFLGMRNPALKMNLAVGVITGVLIVIVRIIIKSVLLSNPANNGDKTDENLEKLLLIGGGYSANDIIKTLNSTLKGKYDIIGIIDDNEKRQGYSVAGVRIIGNRNDIIPICEKYDVDLIFFTIVNIDDENRKEILELCSKTNAKVKILPGLRELISAEENLYQSLRDIEIEDLLGRPSIELDNNNIKSIINNKTVLVTGGGGSIGEELCRQIMLHNPKQLLMLDIYENSLYDIELELKSKYPNNDIIAIIANIRDEKRMYEIFEEYSPDVVFHAAAHKHVPLMENNPTEAIKNNVFGTYNLVNACDKYHTKRFILISTDKAVNPTNIMGATKRLCEMIIQAKDRESETEFVAVRFGNVLGSNGSVVPLFKKQIKEGGPVTVTHKEITRFFMTIPEAVALVLQSITYAKGGEIFVLNMGEPVKIYDLAKSLIELSGLEPGKDIEIKITGMRPGEKLYEELLMNEENLEGTNHEKIFITEPMNFTMDEVEEKLDSLREIIDNDIYDKETIKQTMKKCVPTYKDPKEVNGE